MTTESRVSLILDREREAIADLRSPEARAKRKTIFIVKILMSHE